MAVKTTKMMMGTRVLIAWMIDAERHICRGDDRKYP
jgi:hypothetical protein